MMKYITILVLALSVGYSLADQPRTLINFMPDGTEIKIENGKVFAMCDGKFVVVPNGLYVLADGSEMTVKNGELSNRNKGKKWETYPDEKALSAEETDTPDH